MLIVDNFAGGGGASLGLERAFGRSVDVAINHDPEAIAMHKANHPDTKHFCQSIHSIDPEEACTVDGKVQPVLLAWFSPDCTHFSRAKGKAPKEKGIRDLAWVVVHWAERLKHNKPRVIMLENVREFRDWAPLLEDGQPDPERKGETFDVWVERLRKLGYKVEWRLQRASDFGAPTIRLRLFVIARCDGLPIVWPEPTHGDKLPAKPKPSSSIIDFNIPCPSIFERKRPLVDSTMRRIARGIQKHVLDDPEPFIVSITNKGWDQGRSYSTEKPLPTITTAKGGEFAMVSPSLVSVARGDSGGRREYELSEPLPTTLGKGRIALVSAFMAQHNCGQRNQNLTGRSIKDPLSTITGRGTQQQLVAPSLIKFRKNSDEGEDIRKPLGTVSAQGLHHAEVRAFMMKYYSGGGQDESLKQPLGTVRTKDGFGLVTVHMHGEDYVIVDIGMRMLSARELYRAQGFPDSYRIDPIGPKGKPLTKTAQVRMCGNSVSPVHPKAMAEANLSEYCVGATESAVA